jgi:hypothetical protein
MAEDASRRAEYRRYLLTIMPEAAVDDFMRRCPPADESEEDGEVEATLLAEPPKARPR